MGYRIDYQPVKKLRRVSQQRSHAAALTGLFFLLFLLLTSTLWPEGWMLMRDCLIPGEDAVTVSALNSFSRDLKSGTSLPDAIEGFCQQILGEAILDKH